MISIGSRFSRKANQTIQTAQEESPDLYAEALLEVDRIEHEVNSKTPDELIPRYGDLMVQTRTEEQSFYSEEQIALAQIEMAAIEMKDAQTPETNITGLAYELTFGPGGTHEGIEFVEASSYDRTSNCFVAICFAILFQSTGVYRYVRRSDSILKSFSRAPGAVGVHAAFYLAFTLYNIYACGSKKIES